MNQFNPSSELTAKVAALDEQGVLKIARKRLDSGDDPLSIIEDCNKGMVEVGNRYEQQIYFIAGLIMAGEIFKQVMEIVHPRIKEGAAREDSGRILIGTVKGDIHDIGKDIASMLLRCSGFTVDDIGVNVPPAEFVKQVSALKPDIIGLSCLLTISFEALRETISVLRRQDMLSFRNIPVLIGGAQINDEVCKYVGANYWVDDAMDGVRICQRLLHKKMK